MWSQKLAAMPPKVRLLDDTGGGALDVPWRRIAPGHFSVTRDLDEGGVVRGAVQVGEHALPFGPLSVGSSVEWAFEPERLAELRAVSNQTGGRELLDLSKAWLRPPFIAETSLHLPLGIALVLLLWRRRCSHGPAGSCRSSLCRTACQGPPSRSREAQVGRTTAAGPDSGARNQDCRAPADRRIRPKCEIPAGERQEIAVAVVVPLFDSGRIRLRSAENEHFTKDMSEDPKNPRDRNSVKLERLELALRASNEGIWDWQPGRSRIYYSRRILEFLECGKERAPTCFSLPTTPSIPRKRAFAARSRSPCRTAAPKHSPPTRCQGRWWRLEVAENPRHRGADRSGKTLRSPAP